MTRPARFKNHYYRAIQLASNQADSRPFVEFSLRKILESLSSTPQVRELLDVLTEEKSRAELQSLPGLKDPKSFRARYLIPALDGVRIEPTVPDKPQCPNQKYRLTQKGESERR